MRQNGEINALNLCFQFAHAYYSSMLTTHLCLLLIYAYYSSMLTTHLCLLLIYVYYSSMLTTHLCLLINYQGLIKKLYREFMIMGFISFGILFAEETGHLSKDEWSVSFAFLSMLSIYLSISETVPFYHVWLETHSIPITHHLFDSNLLYQSTLLYSTTSSHIMTLSAVESVSKITSQLHLYLNQSSSLLIYHFLHYYTIGMLLFISLMW